MRKHAGYCAGGTRSPPRLVDRDRNDGEIARYRIPFLRSLLSKSRFRAQGGFGNLIALPLQGDARQKGNSVFVGHDLEPYADQWAYLGGLQRIAREDIERIIECASAAGRILAVRLPLEDEDEEPWFQPPSRRKKVPQGLEILPPYRR